MTNPPSAPPAHPVTAVTYGCPDPAALAEFYRAATGMAVLFSSEDSVYLSDGGKVRLGFDRADATPPEWNRTTLPAVRIDIATDDLAAGEARLLELGATRPGHSADTPQWIFLADPAGNPICLSSVF